MAIATATIVRHRVDDYDAWRQVYDGFAPTQRDAGVTYQNVLRANDGQVVVLHWFESREAAEAFFENSELKETMQRAGVDPSSVQIEFLEDLGHSHP